VIVGVDGTSAWQCQWSGWLEGFTLSKKDGGQIGGRSQSSPGVSSRSSDLVFSWIAVAERSLVPRVTRAVNSRRSLSRRSSSSPVQSSARRLASSGVVCWWPRRMLHPVAARGCGLERRLDHIVGIHTATDGFFFLFFSFNHQSHATYLDHGDISDSRLQADRIPGATTAERWL